MPLFGKDPSKWGRNGDINLKELAEVDFPVHVRLDIREVAEIKHEAAICHSSQGGGQMRRGPPESSNSARSTLQVTTSPGFTAALPAARAMIFSASVALTVPIRCGWRQP